MYLDGSECQRGLKLLNYRNKGRGITCRLRNSFRLCIKCIQGGKPPTTYLWDSACFTGYNTMFICCLPQWAMLLYCIQLLVLGDKILTVWENSWRSKVSFVYKLPYCKELINYNFVSIHPLIHPSVYLLSISCLSVHLFSMRGWGCSKNVFLSQCPELWRFLLHGTLENSHLGLRLLKAILHVCDLCLNCWLWRSEIMLILFDSNIFKMSIFSFKN